MTTTTNPALTNGLEHGTLQFCVQHPTKKVKFYCVNDKEMFCSKCILKHTQSKHEVINCSPKGKLVRFLNFNQTDNVLNLWVSCRYEENGAGDGQ